MHAPLHVGARQLSSAGSHRSSGGVGKPTAEEKEVHTHMLYVQLYLLVTRFHSRQIL